MAATEIKPIRTKRDYDAALKEVERLWGAKSGTADGDWLDILATLIDVYEAEHYPMDPPDPIEAIQVSHGAAGADASRPGRDYRDPDSHRRGPEPKAGAINHDDPPTSRASWHLRRRSDPTEPKKGGVTETLSHRAKTGAW